MFLRACVARWDGTAFTPFVRGEGRLRCIGRSSISKAINFRESNNKRNLRQKRGTLEWDMIYGDFRWRIDSRQISRIVPIQRALSSTSECCCRLAICLTILCAKSRERRKKMCLHNETDTNQFENMKRKRWNTGEAAAAGKSIVCIIIFIVNKLTSCTMINISICMIRFVAESTWVCLSCAVRIRVIENRFSCAAVATNKWICAPRVCCSFHN